MNKATLPQLFEKVAALKADEAVFVSTDKAVKCLLQLGDSATLLFFYTFKSPKAINMPLAKLPSLTASGVQVESFVIAGKNNAESRAFIEQEFRRRGLRINELECMTLQAEVQVKVRI